ncbi:MAG TPA: hypothetical protein VI757_05380 [Bacteroidia bacterium]|nr:hypothetical protein [Bacteroidia bacterium]
MIRKISNEEAAALQFSGSGPRTMPYHHIHSLRAGENLVIDKSDWHRKDTPGKMCRYLEKKNPGIKYQVFRIFGDKGFLVKRLK